MERLTKVGEDGYVYRINCEISDADAWNKLAHYEDLAEKGLLVEIKCHCKDCVHIDCSGCNNETMYCMKHGCYMSGYDGFCAEAEQALNNSRKETLERYKR